MRPSIVVNLRNLLTRMPSSESVNWQMTEPVQSGIVSRHCACHLILYWIGNTEPVIQILIPSALVYQWCTALRSLPVTIWWKGNEDISEQCESIILWSPRPIIILSGEVTMSKDNGSVLEQTSEKDFHKQLLQKTSRNDLRTNKSVRCSILKHSSALACLNANSNTWRALPFTLPHLMVAAIRARAPDRRPPAAYHEASLSIHWHWWR